MRFVKGSGVCCLAILQCLMFVYVTNYWYVKCDKYDETAQDVAHFEHRRELEPLNYSPSIESLHNNTMSEHPDIAVRGKFQKKAIREYCKKYNYPGGKKFPTDPEVLHQFKRHLIFDDERKVIFCFVPKVGSTDMKRLMLYTSGKLSLDTLDWPWVDDSTYLEPALKKASFLNKKLNDSAIMDRLMTYYKFMIVRNPFERIVSAFRDKIEPPLRSPQWYKKFPDRIKRRILNYSRPQELEFWERSVQFDLFNISVTFPEYIRYLVTSDLTLINEHFQPQVEVCHPCLVNYDFYGNFKSYSHDAQAIIAKINANPEYYRDTSLHSSSTLTHRYLPDYYSRLSVRERLKLFAVWYDELAFYDKLYPSESEHYNNLLKMDVEFL